MTARIAMLGAALALMACTGPGADDPDEVAFAAVAPLVSSGEQRLAEGDAPMQFDGLASGTFYALRDGTREELGEIGCEFTEITDPEGVAQRRAGECMLDLGDLGRAFADVECEGTIRTGCRGSFTFTEGQGGLAGIEGGGPVFVEGTEASYTLTGDGRLMRMATATMSWERLAWRVPE